jgi:flagellar basal-body rod protein FlgC
MGLISAIQATTSGLAAQRARMDVVSSNVANVDSTRNADGTGPYKRQVVRFAATGGSSPFANIMARMTNAPTNGVVLTQVTEDNTTPTRVVSDPSNPDADENGMVEMPNIDMVTEMTDLTSANRSYQANVTVLNAIKEMALRALDIGSK